MKRLLMGLVLSVIIYCLAFGQVQVHSQLKLVENIQTATTDTIILDVEAVYFSVSPPQISLQEYQNTIGLGEVLNAVVDTVLFTDRLFQVSESFVDHLYYPIEIYDSSAAQIQFKYTDIFSVATENRAKLNALNWNRVATIKILYNWAAGNDSIFWADSSDALFPYNVIMYNNQNVTGSRILANDDLKDVSLPVQMASFTAAYAPESGVELNWTTASETNCLGFHILRANKANGDFERVTTALIPGQGNSSEYRDYSFIDRSAEWDNDYYYMIHELTIEKGEDSKAFYGPIGISTSQAPASFGLAQNYPNPFNPDTQIRYYLSESSEVSLKIYNLLGEEVYTLFSGNQPEGVYTVQWNGQDIYGRNLASGIYFYKLIAGDHVEIKKMTKMQ